MKIGLLVDGDSEYYALPELLPRIATQHQVLNPLRAPLQPLAPIGQIARVSADACGILLSRGVDRIVVLLDLESRNDCPGGFAQDIADAVNARVHTVRPEVDVLVVMKVRKLENWLVSDPQALRLNPGMFDLPQRFDRQVSPDRADNVDALALLRKWGRPQGSYDKVRGAIAICSRMQPHAAARNSRSFRRFLRVIGDPTYLDQSRLASAGANRC